jgi:hypothetical protein
MLAAVGAGQFDDVHEASSAWYRASRSFEPLQDRHEAYGEVYGRYQECYRKLYAGSGGRQCKHSG